jgi:hypothetical protein
MILFLAALALVSSLPTGTLHVSGPPSACCRGSGHYSGGRGSSHKGGHYSNPSTGNHYRAPGSPRASAPSSRSHSNSTTPRSHSLGTPRPSSPRSKSTSPRARPSSPTVPEQRDSHGRLKRSEEAKRAFERQTGHPGGWPGHVVDHKIPLACGGSDTPSNMQWQTIEEGKAKDKVERKGC